MAIGSSALAAATTGGSNVAIGRSAFAALTTGSSNVGIGAGTVGDDVTTGADNVFIGDASGTNLSTAHTGSVFVGSSAGGNATGAGASGNHSIGIGLQAGTRLFGYQNISIGRRSGGQSSGGDISGNNNILIGAGAAPPANASSDQITFWVNATSSGTVGYNALTRFTGGGWLINYTTSAVTTQTASAALEVNGTTGGFLPPRMATAQRNAISSPATGLNLYNTTTSTNDVNTGAGWYQQPNGLTGSGTLDFPNTLAFTSSDLTITVTGAAVGDIVILGTPVQGANSTFTAFVSATNTVSVRMNNYSALAIDPASAAFKVYVIKN
jgi:hypothetical protein